MAAVQDDKIFERNSMENNKLNNLILAISAEEYPKIFLNTFPKDKAARSYVLCYDQVTKRFRIPDGLKIGSRRIDEYGEAELIHPQLEQLNVGAQCQASVNVYHFETLNRFSNIAAQNVPINDANCKVCLNAHHSTDCDSHTVWNSAIADNHISDETIAKMIKIKYTHTTVSNHSK